MKRPAIFIFLSLALAGFCIQGDAWGQDGASQLFEAQDMVSLRLETDLGLLFSDRGDDPQQQQATLTYTGQDGNDVSQLLKVRLRGNFRKNHCDFPPIRLNFAKKEAHGTLFEGEDKVKLVTHCKDKEHDYEQYVLLEYLSYRLFNELTDFSFRVRLARITYVDTEKARKPLTRYGFLIEDDDAMALRNEGVKLEEEGHHQESTNYDQISKMALFQYMIGNTDWSVSGLHNIRLVHTGESLLPYAVPYDFDFSGFVNATYASPDPRLPIKTVRQRLYRGYCRPESALTTQVALFESKKEQFYRMINEFQPLRSTVRKDTRKYLDAFYKTLASTRRMQRAFIDACQEL